MRAAAAGKVLAPLAVDFPAIGTARSAVIVADSSTFERRAEMRITPLACFQLLVSDRAPGEAVAHRPNAARVDLRITAKPVPWNWSSFEGLGVGPRL